MTLAMLSWGAHRTLINTLESYQTFGISDQEKIIFFQEISETDKRIADKYGFKYLGSNKNIGIAQAYTELVKATTGDTFLFLENDWVALNTGGTLNDGLQLLYRDMADVVRFRHRRFPGNPLWTSQYRGNELSAPQFLLDSVHWTLNPEADFPEYIEQLDNGFYRTTSHYANWTNNPTMFKTDFLVDHILPRIGSRDIEVDLQEWWQEQEYYVCQDSIGIFTHNRVG